METIRTEDRPRERPAVVYRGEHGRRDHRVVQCRRGSISFVDDIRTAWTYASRPNDRASDGCALDPRVIEARLVIANPFIDQFDDPFLELTRVEQVMGRAEARRIALRYAGDIMRTSNWEERFAGRYCSVAEFVDDHPSPPGELYFLAYRLLDDAGEVARLKALGFDGAIHRGSGVSAFDVEYKVFSPEQIDLLGVAHSESGSGVAGVGAISPSGGRSCGCSR